MEIVATIIVLAATAALVYWLRKKAAARASRPREHGDMRPAPRPTPQDSPNEH